jgi:penicillin-binding protein 1C
MPEKLNKLNKKLNKMFQKWPKNLFLVAWGRWQQCSPPQQQRLKLIFGLFCLGLGVRSLPYLVPIRAADIAQTEAAIIFSDRHGQPLGTILTRSQEHTVIVPLDRVAPVFIQGIIAAEDKRYYQSGALDYLAIARAILEAIQAKEIVSGASTITMQLARMLYPNPRTLPGKFQEVWISWRLTAGMTKDEILAAYINRLPMGGNIYGVEAAARNYFGIPAADLNLAQASILAALPNDPTDLNPYYQWEPLKQRQKYVLDRMVADGYITAVEGDRAYREQVQLQPPNQGIVAAPHFLFWLANQVPEDVSQVRTTIDLPLQKFVEAQVKEVVGALSSYNVNHGAAIVLDNKTGEILAYVGSPDYFSDDDLGRNDGVQALRQPGSALKPFLYQLALEKKVIRPNTILADVPTYYPIPGAKVYSPVDYSETFKGPVRVRVALGNSLNIPAVRVLEKVGVATFLERLRQLGFTHLDKPPEHYGLGLALGSGEVSLWELAHAYLTFAKQGALVRLCACAEELLCRGEFFSSSPHPTAVSSAPPPPYPPAQIRSPETVALITDILSDRHARAAAFGVDSVLSLPFPAAVKTGTSSDFRDTWTVGYTTDYTVATWVGNFSGDRMRKVSGVTGAAPLWNRIMLHLHQKGQEPGKFAPPPLMVQRPICAITGLKPTKDCPSVVLEYFAIADLSSYEKENTFELSPEYNEWLSRQHQPRLTKDDLKIVFPQNDDYFLIDPADANPKLEFKLASNPTEPVEWSLISKTGKKKLITNASSQGISQVVFWPLEIGEWTLEVKSGEKIDRVNFQVVLDEYRETPRGFSLVKDE